MFKYDKSWYGLILRILLWGPYTGICSSNMFTMSNELWTSNCSDYSFWDPGLLVKIINKLMKAREATVRRCSAKKKKRNVTEIL